MGLEYRAASLSFSNTSGRIQRPPLPTSRLILNFPAHPPVRATSYASSLLPTLSPTSIARVLAQPCSAAANVVTVHYRLPFPTAIHDTLAAYDWALRHMTPQRALARIGVYGEAIGGSLACMLALTECRLGEGRPVAAALRSPILDWVALDLFASINLAAMTREAGDTTAMTIERYQLELDILQRLKRAAFSSFRNSVSSFDPFASPLLFLRSAGVSSLDKQQTRSDEFTERLGIPPDDTCEHSANASTEARRRRALAYPPRGSVLEIPHMRILNVKGSLLEEQAIEMVRLLRKAEVKSMFKTTSGLKMSEVENADDTEQLQAVQVIADRKFGTENAELLDNWLVEVESAGRWLGVLLR